MSRIFSLRNRLQSTCALSISFAAIFIFGSAATGHVHAQSNTVYKCMKNGKVEYSNAPCDVAAKPAKLKGTVNSMSKESFTGNAKVEEAKGSKTILGVTPPNPIEECRKKGGKLNLEFKACELP